jgi:hypothetical protein
MTSHIIADEASGLSTIVLDRLEAVPRIRQAGSLSHGKSQPRKKPNSVNAFLRAA